MIQINKSNHSDITTILLAFSFHKEDLIRALSCVHVCMGNILKTTKSPSMRRFIKQFRVLPDVGQQLEELAKLEDAYYKA